MPCDLPSVEELYQPIPATPRNEGCGQGAKYHGSVYYYRLGCMIPRSKAVVLTWEGNYCGRQHGDKDHIIVAWDGKAFRVLESAGSGVREAMKKYRKLSAAGAIAIAQRRQQEHRARLDAMPKCKCGSVLLQFEDDQRDDECLGCYRRRKAEVACA